MFPNFRSELDGISYENNTYNQSKENTTHKHKDEEVDGEEEGEMQMS